MRVWFEMKNPAPTAEQVAVAIVAAAREMQCDPERVATGMRGNEPGSYHEEGLRVSRARAYAAIALRGVFECNQSKIARLVAAGSPYYYFQGLDKGLRDKTNRWWDDAVFMRVVAELEKVA